MRIAVLGPLAVDGDDVGLSPRDRVVLSALATRRGEACGADRLADALWPGRPPESWAKILQGCVVRLRKTLGTGSIDTVPNGYRLTVPADEVDAAVFERLLGRAREMLAIDEPERASYFLAHALDLWRGPALPDLAEWHAGQVEALRLDELRLEAEELWLEAALRAGRHGEVLSEARERVDEAPTRERRWALLAITLYRAGRQAEALQTLRQVRKVLADELGLDPGPELVALEQSILRQDASLLVEAASKDTSPTCPYLGLTPYDVDDADTFFGRETQVESCLDVLSARGVLAVVGPSGSGKSSLVRAGIAASLLRSGRPVAAISPGPHPMAALADLPPSGSRLLVVDQAEEAFTLCDDGAERTAFFSRLAEQASNGGLVVALRADRMGDVPAHPDLARLVEEGLHLLGAMSESELRSAIEGPARLAGLSLEHGLVDLLVRDVVGEPGALPLLSHAIRETWLRREGRTLTVAGYQATGGIRGAVAQSAEEVYERVGPALRPALRDLLLRLVTTTDEGEPVRSHLSRSWVATDDQHERLIELLVAARLVTSDDEGVELAHEALARAWPRLRGWLDDDAEGQRTRRHLTVAAEAWESLGRPDSELYRGVRLARAMEWRDRTSPRLTTTEQAFLAAAQAVQEDELRDARDRADREASARRRTRRLAAGLAAALVIAVLTATVAVGFQRDASERAVDAADARTLADANRLAALAATVDSLDLSLLLSAEAARTADTPETRDGLLTALVRNRRAMRIIPVDGAGDLDLGDGGRTVFADLFTRVVSWRLGSQAQPTTVSESFNSVNIDASPTDPLVAVLGEAETGMQAVVYSATGERRLVVHETDLSGYPLEVAFTPDGRGLLFAVVNGGNQARRAAVQRVDLSTGAVRTVAAAAHRSPGAAFLEATFADDGTAAALWSEGTRGPATIVDLRGGERSKLRVEKRSVESTGFAPLPDGAAQFWADGVVTLYDGRGRVRQRLDAHTLRVVRVVVARDGSWAATAGEDGVVTMWTIDATNGAWARQEQLTGHTGAVAGMALAPDDARLVTGSQDQTLVVWDMSADAGFGSAFPGLDGRWIANRPELLGPDGPLVAPTRPVSLLGGGGPTTPAPDTALVAATFIDPTDGRVIDEVEVGNTIPANLFGSSVAVSPDRQLIAVTAIQSTTVLDARSHEVVGRITLPPADPTEPNTPEQVNAAGWTPDGRLLLGVAGGGPELDGGGLVVVGPQTWQPRDRVALGTNRTGVQSIETSPDGDLLAVASDNGADVGIWLLDANTLEERGRLLLDADDNPHDVSFSPSGDQLAVGGRLGVLSVFEVATGRLAHEPVGMHDAFIQQVEWTRDGNTVVTSGADGRVALYDARRDIVRAVPLPGSSDPHVSANLQQGYTHLLPDIDDEIVALSGERPGHVYPLDPDLWLAQACAVAGRDLTQGEWARYLPDRPYRRTCTSL